ncbi:hypothetical protein MMC07_005906 [Pseudocyphellaria aurata]|nr:hypothetical protein [Pseudocyphellaria aurata]
MNTIRSTWYGWGALAVAGGGAYYFAKRSVNADRKARHEADMKRRRLADSLEASARQSNHKESHRNTSEASHDPNSTKHPENDRPRVQEKSKYEASEPYRAKRGDRFS